MDLKLQDEIDRVKLSLKRWEVNFSKSNVRKPNKDDIKTAGQEIQDLYRLYWKLQQKLQEQKTGNSPKDADNSAEKLEVWSSQLNKTSGFSLTNNSVPSTKTYSLINISKNIKSPVHITKQLANGNPKLKPPAAQTLEVISKPKSLPEQPETNLSNTITCPEYKKLQEHECTPVSPYLIMSQNQKRRVNTDWLQRCEDSIWKVNSQPTEKHEIFVKSELKSRQDDAPPDHDFDLIPSKTEPRNNADMNTSNCGRVGEIPSPTMEIVKNTCADVKECVTMETETVEEISENPHRLQRRKSTLKRELSEACQEDLCQPKKRIKTSLSSGCGVTEKKSVKPTENYVRINLKKKIFVRGKHKFNYKRYKWQKYKNYKRNQNQMREDDEATKKWETANSRVRSTKSVKNKVSKENQGNSSEDENVLDDEDIASKLSDATQFNVSLTAPLYKLSSKDGTVSKTPQAVYTALKKFGYNGFRVGQEAAIMRVLSGLSTLVVLPTGSGKSLCYQLPAYLYSQRSSCITLVVSPLVSLMEDQVANMPSMVKAACLHNNMTETRKDKVREDIATGNVRVLFVSPEAVVARLNGGFSCMPKDMPPIAFVCIDEVHCLWEWSFNFRPSYLQLCKALKRVLNVKCILGLTATATAVTMKNVGHHLGIDNDPDAIIQFWEVPKNLHFSVSRDENREQALLNLLRNSRFSKCSSVIIYCITRAQTEKLAVLIRTALQDYETDEDSWTAEAYHAGLSAACRKKVQTRFVTGKLRVVVATVAFGMGLNKPDVRAVIHFGLPNSFESYIQETGRAGRDGQQSFCHVLLDTVGHDLQELRRHVYANSVDRQTIRRLLEQIFPDCHCNEDFGLDNNIMDCAGHEVAIPVKDATMSLDMKEEGIATLLCLLELHPTKYVDFLPSTLATCKLRCYGGTEQLHGLKKKSPAIAVALAKYGNVDQKFGNVLQFPVVDVSFLLGRKSQEVKRDIRQLEWEEITDVEGNKRWRRTGVKVEFCDESFHFIAKGGLSNDQKDEILDNLHDRVVTQEKKGLMQLNTLYQTLLSSAPQSVWLMSEIDEKDVERSENLRHRLCQYFHTGNIESQVYPEIPLEEPEKLETEGARSDIRNFICIHQEHTFSGRAVARIFHGIGSPRFPVEVWGRVRRFWRCQLDIDFNVLCKLATEEILKLKSF